MQLFKIATGTMSGRSTSAEVEDRATAFRSRWQVARALPSGALAREVMPMPTKQLQSRSGIGDMTRLTIATRIEEACRGRGEDRIAVVDSNHKLIVVADGAGGVAGGATAAEAICQALIGDVNDWTTWLAQQDVRLAEKGTGMAAAIVLSISDDGEVRGASVGDCEAWVFGQGEPVNLTAGQVRKPLLGDGTAVPTSFIAPPSGGTLIVATDGLWKYMSRARIAEASAMRPLEAALAALVDGVRLRSGALQDDVAIVMCAVNGA